MAFAIDTYTGNGSTTTYSVTFPYIEKAHVIVTLDGVTQTLTTDYTFVTSSTITFTTAPAAGVVIKFTRSSNRTARLVDYQDGSTLTESTLDQDGNQSFFMAQEAIDVTENTIGLTGSDEWDANNKKIINVTDPTTNQGAATKNYVDTKLAADVATVNSYKTSAETAATNAATSETNANTANTNAQSALTQVQTLYDTFDDRFLGAKSSNPTVDNDGNSLQDGALYWDTQNNLMKVYDLSNTQWVQIQLSSANQTNVNTVAGQISPTNNIGTVAGANSNITTIANDINGSNNLGTVATNISNVNNVGGSITNVNSVATNLTDVNAFGNTYKISATAPTGVAEGTLWFDTTNDIMKVYDGSAFANAGSSVNGTSQRNKFTATAGQTVFSGNDDDGVALAYDPNFLDTYLNGVRIINGSDYTATDGSTITLTSGASAGDILSVVSFGTFQLASFSATAITSDTLPVARGGTGLSSLGSSGQALVVNSGGTGLEYANASSAEVYGFETYYTPSTLNIAVTVQNVSGSNVYFIDGVQQDTLNLLEGNTYVFSYPSAHPFALSTTANGTHGGGTEYTTGVTRDTGANTLTFVVPSNAPQLYYYCTAHSNMGGTANTPVPANNSLRYITTNQGQDNITSSQYANFDDVLFSASGFTFSLSNGELIATI